MIRIKYIISMIFCFSILMGCNGNSKKEELNKNKNLPVKVTLQKTNNRFQLLVNNKPFYIKGAGLEFGNIPSVAAHNGNSFRTWRTENGQQSAIEILDEAQANGLMVTMGIEVARERHGFDYNNTIAVKKQLESIKKEVLELKDHPALLIWAIGNELNLRATNPKVWDAVNEISKMIQIDTNHLTTTTLAGISQKEIDLIKERSSDLDLLSFQVYGKLQDLPNMVKEFGWEGAYMVTEWGATGHWEVPKTEWGVPIEENSTLKAANYLKRYKGGIEVDSLQCIGSYVFLWGQKQERTPTWYGVFLEDGKETESVDVMHYIWTGTWPKNRAPQIESFTINNKTAYDNIVLEANKEYLASIIIHDFENDTLNYHWEILYESTDLHDGGDKESKPETLNISVLKHLDGQLKFKGPKKKGIYRLFAYVDDGQQHAATANIPFKVN